MSEEYRLNSAFENYQQPSYNDKIHRLKNLMENYLNAAIDGDASEIFYLRQEAENLEE